MARQGGGLDYILYFVSTGYTRGYKMSPSARALKKENDNKSLHLIAITLPPSLFELWWTGRSIAISELQRYPDRKIRI